MPEIETVDDLAERLADMMMVYSSDRCAAVDCECREEWGNHQDECLCRMCFTSDIRRRIRESVENERKLNV